MELLSFVQLLDHDALMSTAHSALPQAPVVPQPVSVPARRSRAVLSAALRRAAERIAPPEPVTACPAR
jgi:hypothetical protein